MGQCCNKCRERPEEGGEVRREENTRDSIAPLVLSRESPEEEDVTIGTPVHQQDESSDTPEVAPSPPMGDYINYPIFQDRKTIEYVQNSKVVVILKGLPGSGKSYLSRTLKEMYKDATVCSADFYFMKDGEYKFRADQLKFAHQDCQDSSEKAAVSSAPVIVIDNTNLQAWNYKYYLRLSKNHNYTPLIMEPQTPWAKNPKKLAEMNTHGINKEGLEEKLKKYEPALPLYYWWFLNEEDSSLILNMAQDWLKKSLKIQEFFDDFSEFSNLSSFEDMLSYYKRNEGKGDYKVLHATASVTRKGKAKNAKEYMAKKAVKNSLGKCFTLYIIGFVLTPRTFGARLRLEEEAMEVWGMDDDEKEAEDTSSNTASQAPQKTGQQFTKENERVSIADTNLRRGSCHSTLKTGKSQHHIARFHPTAGRGSRAHLTLGCAPQVHAKITGFDLMKVVSCEQRILNNENPEESVGVLETFSIPEGELRTYGDNIWVIYPEKEINVNSLFSGFY